MSEDWKNMVGFEGLYLVSSHGRVFSVGSDRLLRPWIDGHGYPVVTLHRDGILYRRKVHRLVLGAFVGPRPPGMECRHLDNDPTNNHVSNLRWGSPKENAADSIQHDTQPRGERHGAAKLTEDAVRMIFKLREMGLTQMKIAELLEVSRSLVGKILSGRRWRQVTEQREVRE